MKIEIWADIICPWCGLGDRYLQQAIAASGHADDIEVVHRSFQLQPDTPEGKAEPALAMLQRKYGMSSQQITQSNQRIEAMAHEAGISEYHVLHNNVGNTGLAHEFLAYATAHGKHADAWQLMFSEYFGRIAPIWTVEDLLPLATRLEFDVHDVRAALEEHRYRAAVEADYAQAAKLGVRGVPFIVIDERYGAAGAQPADVLSDAIQQAWDEAQSSAS